MCRDMCRDVLGLLLTDPFPPPYKPEPLSASVLCPLPPPPCVIRHSEQHVARGEVSFSYVPTTGMAADFLTKSVPPTKHKFCCQALGIS